MVVYLGAKIAQTRRKKVHFQFPSAALFYAKVLFYSVLRKK